MVEVNKIMMMEIEARILEKVNENSKSIAINSNDVTELKCVVTEIKSLLAQKNVLTVTTLTGVLTTLAIMIFDKIL